MSDAPQVVVVDDDAEVLKQVLALLTPSFRTAGAVGPAEALRLFDRSGPDVAVLVTDMRLPGDGHGGLTLARELRRRKLDVRIIFFTAYPCIEDAGLCMEVDSFGYVEKGRPDTFERLADLTRRAHQRWLETRPAPGPKPRLLVLDDYPDVVREIGLFLARRFEVSSAQTLNEAYDLLEREAADGPFRVVVTDMRLRDDRRGGLRLAEELNNRRDRPEIIFLTGYPQIEDASLCMQAGAFGYVEKGRADTFHKLEDLCVRGAEKWRQRQEPGRAEAKGSARAPKEGEAAARADPAGGGGLTEIFVSYSHKDTRYLEEFEDHMAALHGHGITTWSDTRIAPGSAWQEEIASALGRARTGVALVSKNYISSPFCTNVEMQGFLRAWSERGLKLVAVILSECLWQVIPDISRFQVLPRDKSNYVKPVKLFKDKDSAWTAVVKAIADLLEEQPPGAG